MKVKPENELAIVLEAENLVEAYYLKQWWDKFNKWIIDKENNEMPGIGIEIEKFMER